jgi:hypothetical protein
VNPGGPVSALSGRSMKASRPQAAGLIRASVMEFVPYFYMRELLLSSCLPGSASHWDEGCDTGQDSLRELGPSSTHESLTDGKMEVDWGRQSRSLVEYCHGNEKNCGSPFAASSLKGLPRLAATSSCFKPCGCIPTRRHPGIFNSTPAFWAAIPMRRDYIRWLCQV